MRLIRKVVPLACIVAALALGATGCGGDDGDGDGGSASATATTATSTKIDGTGKTFLYLASGGSADFVEGLKDSFLPAFAKETGFKMATDTFCCGIEKLRTQVNAKKVQWSATNFATISDFEQAKAAGLLEKLDPKVVPTNLLKPGTYDEYGYQTYIAGTVVAYLPKSYPDAASAPTSFKDLFDTQKFPGKRCLYKYPQFGGTLEGALLADGVAADQMYPLDLDRALKKLSTIKKDVVWWTSGSQAAQFLLNGNCKIAAMWSGVAQNANARGDDIKIAWDGSLIFAGMNAIPKNSPNPEAAQKFLGDIITNTEAQAKFYNKVAYVIPLKDPNIPADVAQWAPEGDNLKTAVTEDDQYYLENTKEITKRFNNWLVSGK